MIDELAQTYAHYVALRRELSLWVEQSIRRDGPDKNQGGEDEANFALAFFPHYLVSGNERIAVRFRSLANDLKAWVRAECLYGYEAEAHHGTEPFLLFLPRYLGLFPDDRQAADPQAPRAMIFPQERKRREPGVGKRSDMIYWGHWAEDGSVQPTREPSTAALALGYQLTGEWTMARQALEWRMAGAADWQRVELAPGEVWEYPLETEIGRGGKRGTP